MSERFSKVFGRALAYCAGVGDGTFKGLVERVAWELDHECRCEFSSLAIVIRRHDGSYFIGRPKEAHVLPAETLLGMLLEESGGKTPCRVRDHALDTVRFLDARFRGSIVTRIAIPRELLERAEAIIWFGLSSIATSKQVNSARLISEEFSDWLSIYFPIIESLKLYSDRVSGLRLKIDQMTGVAHDVKAPLAALKYLISDVSAEHPQIYDEACRLCKELEYAEALLAKFAPSGLSSELEMERAQRIGDLVDIMRVIRRVVDRFEYQASEQSCRFKLLLPYGTGSRGEVSELDLERALSNVIGNAVRYSGPGEICIEVKQVEKGQKNGEIFWKIGVSDRGPGIPQSVIDRVAIGDRVADRGDTRAGVNGWGVGLLNARSSLLSQGGELVISSNKDTPGASVDIYIRSAPSEPQAKPSSTDACAQSLDDPRSFVRTEYCSVSDGGVEATYGDVELVLVDDDVDHTDSLARALSRYGVGTKTFSTVAEATHFIASNPKATVLCDTHMPNGEGAEYLLRLLARDNIKPRVGIMSGESSDYSLYRFAALGAREFFSKPIDIERLIGWIGNPSASTPA